MTRPLTDYVAAMAQWLTCTLLDPLERQIVEKLKEAAETDEETFWAAVDEAKLYLSFPLWGAMVKALSQGLCTTWENVNVAA